MKETKRKSPRKLKPSFIKFSEVETNYLNEVRNRQVKEWSEVLLLVYKGRRIDKKILQAPRGTYILRPDCSGLDIIPGLPTANQKSETDNEQREEEQKQK